MNRSSAAVWTLIVSLFTLSCASTHPGRKAERLDSSQGGPQMEVSVKAIENNTSDTFSAFDVTFENLEDDWAKVDTVEVLIDDAAASKIGVIVGQDLNAWAEAMSNQMEKDQHNKGLLLGAIAAGGAIAAIAASGGKSDAAKVVSAAGAVAVAGTLSYVVIDSLNAKADAVNNVRKVPDNHIYHPFTVPGKMFIRRWVLLKKPSKVTFDQLSFRVKTIDGRSADYVARVNAN